jgi:hypothetical protein
MVNFARFSILAIGSAALALSTAAGGGEALGAEGRRFESCLPDHPLKARMPFADSASGM